MSKPYLLLSDTHYHDWDAFSSITEDGINSRLQILLEETERAFRHLREEGGDKIIHAGDMFHTRGSLVPSVLNPVIKLYKYWSERMSINAIAGNHDLESNTTHWLTAATSAMPVFFAPQIRRLDDVVMVNWIPKMEDLAKALEDLRDRHRDHSQLDVVIHAPVNGVLNGIPPHGLDSDYLASLGFRRVFAGHYHNHKHFGNGVYSIGALTHQTWSDVGTKAGYCLVYPDRVDWFESHAPKFVSLPDGFLEEAEEVDMLDACDGHYVRATLKSATAVEEAEVRARIEAAGAKGIILRNSKASVETITRRSETLEGVETIDQAVAKFAERKGGKALVSVCEQIMKACVA